MYTSNDYSEIKFGDLRVFKKETSYQRVYLVISDIKDTSSDKFERFTFDVCWADVDGKIRFKSLPAEILLALEVISKC